MRGTFKQTLPPAFITNPAVFIFQAAGRYATFLPAFQYSQQPRNSRETGRRYDNYLVRLPEHGRPVEWLGNANGQSLKARLVTEALTSAQCQLRSISRGFDATQLDGF